jgi:hypothetical protein
VLIREDDRGVLAIGQQSHAWLSGQLARAWGNEQFGQVEPPEEVCLAADQHDVGWGTWDQEPLWNPQSGRARSFMEMPLESHLDLFTQGPRRLISQSRYVALLASMHGSRLYARRDLNQLPAEDARAIERFLAEQRAFQADLVDSLRADPLVAAHVHDDRLERNSLLIWTWDYLSLALCLNWAAASAKSAPTATGRIDVNLTYDRHQGVHRLDPWPLRAARVTVSCEGRRLPTRFDTERDLREAFANAPWETLELRLEAV